MKPTPPATPPKPWTPPAITPHKPGLPTPVDYPVTLLTDGTHFITVPTATYNAHKGGYAGIGYIEVPLAP